MVIFCAKGFTPHREKKASPSPAPISSDRSGEIRFDFVQRLSPAFAEFRLGFVRHLLHLLDEFRLGFVRPLSPFPDEFRLDFVQRSPLPSTNSDLVIYKRGCYSLRFSFKMKVIG